MVVDTSAVLAICFGEEHGGWVLGEMNQSAERLLMSTVNYTESLILIADKRPGARPVLQEWMKESGVLLVPPSSSQAELAAEARRKYPLNLGDCFAYALAKEESCPLLAVDRDFRAVDLKVLLPPGISRQ